MIAALVRARMIAVYLDASVQWDVLAVDAKVGSSFELRIILFLSF